MPLATWDFHLAPRVWFFGKLPVTNSHWLDEKAPLIWSPSLAVSTFSGELLACVWSKKREEKPEKWWRWSHKGISLGPLVVHNHIQRRVLYYDALRSVFSLVSWRWRTASLSFLLLLLIKDQPAKATPHLSFSSILPSAQRVIKFWARLSSPNARESVWS